MELVIGLILIIVLFFFAANAEDFGHQFGSRKSGKSKSRKRNISTFKDINNQNHRSDQNNNLEQNKYSERIPPQPLTGKELLEKINLLGDIPISEVLKGCGYCFSTKKGERLNYTKYYGALLEAKGKGLSLGRSSQRSIGLEKLNYIATVNDDGEIEIGKEYTELIDLKPGDQLDIKMGRKGFRLILIDPEGKENNLWRFVDPENK